MARAATLQARTQALAGKPLPAALTLILLAQTDSSSDPQQLHNEIWNYLKNASPDQLGQAADNAMGFEIEGDRKSTRLNSSHVRISYAVFCLKKKTKNN